MTPITQVISPIPTAPDPATPSTFVTLAAPFTVAVAGLDTELNTLSGQINVIAGEIDAAAAAAADSEAAAATSETNAAASALSATSSPGTSGTSTTSLTLALGQLSFTTQTGKTWSAGMSAVLARTSDPSIRAEGYIVSYNSGTGAVVFYAEMVAGSGPYTDWTFSHQGAPGEDADLLMLSWAPAANASVTVERNGYMCRPSATLTLTPDSAAALGDGFTMMIAPTAGTTTVAGSTIIAGEFGILHSNGAAVSLVKLGASLSLVSTATASSSAAIAFTGLAAGFDYVVMFDGVVPASAGADQYLRVSEDNGAAYKSGGTDYGWLVNGNYNTGTAANSGAVDDSKIPFGILTVAGGSGPSAGANDQLSGSIHLYNPGGAKHKQVRIACEANTAAGFAKAEVSGRYKGTANAINAIQITMSSGNIASGTFRLYRLARS